MGYIYIFWEFSATEIIIIIKRLKTLKDKNRKKIANFSFYKIYYKYIQGVL